ncbi:MAG: hypothetical protein P0Y53_18710 [Candidatus Pseudobacter hemicellulosilyticus]|uniref:Uncharacterized protein n=1 Tax=Candidatus Pseudobacter hemicellulosilyticus TaxID=3121375 RepID=A0AAJ5WQ44_9BACT|nr:MAG: hypothetical protein P0Y53_18710 [Pseudobacter sp.]
MPAEGKLEINDPFWLNLGAEVVYNSSEARRKAVERLQAAIVWVFGVYSSLTIGTIVFGEKKDLDNNALLLFGSAFFFLIIAYWTASLASFPSPEKFYGQAVESIRDAYLVAAKKGKRLFYVSILLCTIGVILYSLTIFYQFGIRFFSKKNEKTVAPIVQSPEMMIKKLGEGNYAVHIRSKKDAWIMVSVIRDSAKDNKLYSDLVDFSVQGKTQQNLWLYIDSTANFSYNFFLPQNPDHTYYLCVNRTDTLFKEGELHTFRKKTKLN